MPRLFLFLVLLAVPAWAASASKGSHCGCACCEGKTTCCCAADAGDAAPETAVRAKHPLRGQVVSIDATQAKVLVKHEAIPGYMPAMTMQFQVDAAVVPSLRKNQIISGTLVEREDGFWLVDVAPVKP